MLQKLRSLSCSRDCRLVGLFALICRRASKLHSALANETTSIALHLMASLIARS